MQRLISLAIFSARWGGVGVLAFFGRASFSPLVRTGTLVAFFPFSIDFVASRFLLLSVFVSLPDQMHGFNRRGVFLCLVRFGFSLSIFEKVPGPFFRLFHVVC